MIQLSLRASLSASSTKSLANIFLPDLRNRLVGSLQDKFESSGSKIIKNGPTVCRLFGKKSR